MGNEKKIQRDIEFIKEYLDRIYENKNAFREESNIKKKGKLNKKIDADIRMTILYIKELDKLGAETSFILNQLSDTQHKTIAEILPNGFESRGMEEQRNRNIIINRHKKKIIKIQEARSKYPAYDPELSTKEKLENKIYKLEKSLGRDLYIESDKERVSYQRDWNYLEHMEETKEFTEEEREIMDRCYRIGEEYDTYWMEKFERIGEVAQSLGDKTQARVWCRMMYREVFSPFIESYYSEKRYSSRELEYESKEMTKRFIEFVLDERKHDECVKKWIEIYSDRRLDGNSEKEKEDIVVNAMEKVVGVEKTLFTSLYVGVKKTKSSIELIGNYTYEELGLE